MPNEIEDYVHRIGRTGRGGSTGIATTFVDPSICSEAVLMDLKLLLLEAKQYVPEFLSKLGQFSSNSAPCSLCGGLGHIIDKCPKVMTVFNPIFLINIFRSALWLRSNCPTLEQITMIANINICIFEKNK